MFQKAIYIFLLLNIFLFINLESTLAKQQVFVVTDSWAPYVYEENGEIKGSDYETMMAVFDLMGVAVDFKILPWKRCIDYVAKSQADAILDISKNEARLKIMYFPETPMSESQSVLFYKKGEIYKINRLKDLAGLKVGTIDGYEYNADFLNADYFIKEPVQTEEQNVNKLLLKRIDFFIANKNVGLFQLKKMNVQHEIDYLSKPISGGSNYLAFSLQEEDIALAKSFSNHLKRFKKSSEYKAILDKYGLGKTFDE